MEVGVDPRTILAFVPLRGFVGTPPIGFGIPPQSDEFGRESGRRLGRVEGLAEFV